MVKVDAHQHLWSVGRGDYGWMDGNAAVAAIRRDIGPQDLHPVLTSAGIARTVLVQAAPTVFETEYMLGLADATPWIGKVVGWIDFEDQSHRRHLERLARHPKFSGVRPMIQDLPDPEWMHRKDVQWGFQALIDLDLTFDALGYPVHIEPFQRLFDRYPNLRTVIDHGMKPRIKDGVSAAYGPWAAGTERLARTTGAFCKLSGLATEAGPGWNTAALAPYARHLIDVFGAGRLMWGSDWPVLELAGTYPSWHDATTQILRDAALTPAECEAVFGGTAARFYRF
jgi:L-fuconolactonase